MLRSGGKTSAFISHGRKKLHTTFEDGSELVEEYHLETDELLVRKRRQKTVLGGEGPWVFEIGEEGGAVAAGKDLFRESSVNPQFLRKDSSRSFEWRIRNLPYPSSTYSVTEEGGSKIVVRTTNKKYYKGFGIPEMEKLGLPLEGKAIGWSHANNTLIISYAKPVAILQAEAEDKKERTRLKAERLPTEEESCKQQ